MKNGWLAGAALSLLLSSCMCGGGGGGEDGGTEATLDVAASSLTVDRSTDVKADGADAVNITVTLMGSDAQPMANVVVALSATGDGNTLTQSVTTNAQGVATGTLKSTRAGMKTLSASVDSVELSQHPTVTFTASGAAHLVIGVQPSNAVAGAVIAPEIAVSIEDAFGNVLQTRTDITVAVSGGAVLKGSNLVRTAADGVARFVHLSIETAGRHTLVFSSAGVPDLTSASFDIRAGPVVTFAFVSQPTSAVAGTALSPAVTVRAQDVFGNTPDFSGEVMLRLPANAPTGATLGGTTTVNAVAGLATFSDLVIDNAATGYTLEALAPMLGIATSATFDIAPAAASQLRFVVQPGDSVSGQLISPAVSVVLVDAFENTAATSDVVTLSLNNNASLDGGVSLAATAGVAEFVDLSINLAGVDYMLTATSGALTAQSVTFDVIPAAPSALTSTLVASPSMVLADGMATSTVLATVRDAQGNSIAGATVVLSADAGTTVVQPPMTTDVAGQASGLVSASAPLLATVTADVGTVTLTTTIAFVACLPTTTRSCYTGTSGTADVGVCRSGTSTCDATGAWGSCVGEVLPTLEICGNARDEDCNGINDDSLDEDGDGWARCDGDCCDDPTSCSVPAAMNPGAVEVTNGLDDNCDGAVDNLAATACSTSTKFAAVSAFDIARSMDICQTATVAGRGAGLISAVQLLANGMSPNASALANLQNKQMAVTTVFGNTVVPLANATLAGLSTGAMRDANDPDWVIPITGTQFGQTIAFPTTGLLGSYLAQNNNQLVPGACGTVACPVGSGANDSAMVRLQLRVPTNATGFTFDYRFFSSEYQTFQCTQFNDHFLALLSSTSNGALTVRNVAVNALGQPVSVNAGRIDVCGGNGKNCGTCPLGTAALAGTGFDNVNGGATPWQTATGTVTAGEVMTLELMIFDVADQAYDTDVLLDNFRWTTVTNAPISQPQ